MGTLIVSVENLKFCAAYLEKVDDYSCQGPIKLIALLFCENKANQQNWNE